MFKPPSQYELMHLLHFAIEVGKLTKEGLQRFSEWLEEQNQPTVPTLPTAPTWFQLSDIYGANEPRNFGTYGTVGERRSSDRLSFDEIVQKWNTDPKLSPSRDSWRCRAVTKAGTQCANKNTDDTAFCWIHRPDGQCHGVTADGRRCRRRTKDFACLDHTLAAVFHEAR